MDRQGWATSTLGRQAVTVETPLVFASAHAMPFSGSASMMLSISLTFFSVVCVRAYGGQVTTVCTLSTTWVPGFGIWLQQA